MLLYPNNTLHSVQTNAIQQNVSRYFNIESIIIQHKGGSKSFIYLFIYVPNLFRVFLKMWCLKIAKTIAISLSQSYHLALEDIEYSTQVSGTTVMVLL